MTSRNVTNSGRLLGLPRTLFATAMIAAAVAAMLMGVVGEPVRADDAPLAASGEVLVRFSPDAPSGLLEHALGALGGEKRRYLGQINVWLIDTEHKNEEAVIAGLQHNPWVEFAELNFLSESAFTPDDTDYLTPGLIYGPQTVGAPTAWDTTLGDPGVVIAVVDSGVDGSHVEFAGRMLAGKDFVNADNDASDDHGHGTNVAGIAAAGTDNTVGIAGIAQASILPVKVLDSSNAGSWADIASGIIWAADNGADIINLSLAGATGSETLAAAVDYAHGQGALLIVAAGNAASSSPYYPAAYAQTLAVAATNETDVRWSLSNVGAHLDLSAPGDSILSTDWISGSSDHYAVRSGTSQAAPHVSGIAALMLSANDLLSRDEVANLLKSTSVDLGVAGHDALYGEGRVDAAAAVQAAVDAAGTPPPAPTPIPPSSADTLVVDALETGVLSGKGRKKKFNAQNTFDVGQKVELRAHVVEMPTPAHPSMGRSSNSPSANRMGRKLRSTRRPMATVWRLEDSPVRIWRETTSSKSSPSATLATLIVIRALSVHINSQLAAS